jgi:transposase-like protein
MLKISFLCYKKIRTLKSRRFILVDLLSFNSLKRGSALKKKATIRLILRWIAKHTYHLSAGKLIGYHWHNLWRAFDQDGEVVDVYLQE